MSTSTVTTLEAQMFYTASEAAAYLGVSENVISNQLQRGKIAYGTAEQRGRYRLFTRAALDAYDAQRKAWSALRERSTTISDDGKKWCSACQSWIPVSGFDRRPKSVTGLRSECKKCAAIAGAEYRAVNCESHRLKARRYYQGNKASVLEAKRRHRQKYRLLYRGRYDAHKAEENRRRIERNRENSAVEDGKTSPITKRTGFFVALCPDGSVRAARVGIPLPPGEKQLAHFEYRAPLSPSEKPRWVVSLPSVVVPSLQARAKRLVKRHGGYVPEGVKL